jgi:hypothetical protein
MEYYSTIKKNEIMPFARNGMELVIIMLREISQVKKPNIICSHSFVEPRPKMEKKMMIITGHAYKSGTEWSEGIRGRQK